MKLLYGALLSLSVKAATGSIAADALPSQSEIRVILSNRLEQAEKSLGIVVGVIDESGQRIVGYGHSGSVNGREVDGNTLFEIGSATKVFTGTLLADMAKRGEVQLDVPISKYLPKSVKVPTRDGREITLLDLATHRSALPRMPDNMTPKDPENPYADYTVEQLYAFLSDCTLSRDIGAKYEYSNLGVGLLGHILSLVARTNYEALVLQRICRPLGMTSTAITLSPQLKARLAVGHDESGQATANWDIPTLAGAGALRSTASDLLKFVAANLGLVKSDLWPAMQMAQESRNSAGGANLDIGLCWHISKINGSRLVWHNGGTGGYHSFMGFDPQTKRGVVVLANSANSIDDIGVHLLDASRPLSSTKPAKGPATISLPPESLRRYVGQYELAPGALFSLRTEKNRLMARLTGQSYVEIFPKSETEFFYKVVDAQISFATNKEGKVTSLVLHQNGLDQTAKKISDQPATERQVKKVDPKLYDSYAGEYQLAPGALFTIRREGDKLMARLTGQSFMEIFPESEKEYFYKAVDAQITFVTDSAGSATALVLHQNGLDQKAKKVK